MKVRVVELKRCTRCGERKPHADFHKNCRKVDGLDPMCKACNNERQRIAYAEDPAPKIVKTRAYHVAHPEWSKERLRAHHEANSVERYQRYVERGKDPVVRAKRRESTRRSEQRRRAIKARVDNDIIGAHQYAGLLEAYENKCYICGAEFSNEVVLHWDHYKPLAAGGAHTIDNIRPACGDCNVRKNARWPITKKLLRSIAREVIALRKSVVEPGRG